MKKLSLGYTAMAAILACAAGSAQAQFEALGPVYGQGHVSVDLSGIGVPVTDFACKIRFQGRTSLTNANVIDIESVQSLNHADGMAPSLCATVNMANLPWFLTVAGTPSGSPVEAYPGSSISGVSFDSLSVPGDGCQGTINGTWYENDQGIPLVAYAYPSYSRFVAENVWMGAEDESCFINKLILKVNRPTGLVFNP